MVSATIFEAMAAGCPLIVSKDKSYDDVIQSGYNALSVDAQDVEQVSEAVIQLLTDSSLSAKLRDQENNSAE